MNHRDWKEWSTVKPMVSYSEGLKPTGYDAYSSDFAAAMGDFTQIDLFSFMNDAHGR